jgi:hypothetical protein
METRTGWLDDTDGVKQHQQPLKQLQVLLAAELGEAHDMNWDEYEIKELAASTAVTTDADVQELPLNAHLEITRKPNTKAPSEPKLSQEALRAILQQQGFHASAIEQLLAQQPEPAQSPAKKQKQYK